MIKKLIRSMINNFRKKLFYLICIILNSVNLIIFIKGIASKMTRYLVGTYQIF